MQKWIDALKNNSTEQVKHLIESGEDVNAENESGESVLAYALRSHCDFSLLMFLVENGADIYDFDNEGVSIFEMAITYNNIQMVKYFLDKSIDVNSTKRKSGFTPLMCASSYGRNSIVELLLKNGADKEVKDRKGFTAIDFARKMNKRSILRLLDYNENAKKNTLHAR